MECIQCITIGSKHAFLETIGVTYFRLVFLMNVLKKKISTLIYLLHSYWNNPSKVRKPSTTVFIRTSFSWHFKVGIIMVINYDYIKSYHLSFNSFEIYLYLKNPMLLKWRLPFCVYQSLHFLKTSFVKLIELCHA